MAFLWQSAWKPLASSQNSGFCLLFTHYFSIIVIMLRLGYNASMARTAMIRAKTEPELKALGMKKINTSFVERMNLTFRHMVSRLRRKGLTFSKKRQYLKWHLNLAVAYYQFVRPHRELRQRLPEPIPTKGNCSPKKWDKRTPAMSAALTDHIWSMQELLTFRTPQTAVVCS
jgi:hypothetical protein